jgi:hypothetical protein
MTPPATPPAIAPTFVELLPPPPTGVEVDGVEELVVTVTVVWPPPAVVPVLVVWKMDVDADVDVVELEGALETWELSGKSTPKCEHCFFVKCVQVLLTACQFCNGDIEAITGVTGRYVRPMRNDCVRRNRSWVRALIGSHALWAVRLPSCPGDPCAVLAGTASRHQFIDNSRADTWFIEKSN